MGEALFSLEIILTRLEKIWDNFGWLEKNGIISSTSEKCDDFENFRKIEIIGQTS